MYNTLSAFIFRARLHCVEFLFFFWMQKSLNVPVIYELELTSELQLSHVGSLLFICSIFSFQQNLIPSILVQNVNITSLSDSGASQWTDSSIHTEWCWFSGQNSCSPVGLLSSLLLCLPGRDSRTHEAVLTPPPPPPSNDLRSFPLFSGDTEPPDFFSPLWMKLYPKSSTGLNSFVNFTRVKNLDVNTLQSCRCHFDAIFLISRACKGILWSQSGSTRSASASRVLGSRVSPRSAQPACYGAAAETARVLDKAQSQVTWSCWTRKSWMD